MYAFRDKGCNEAEITSFLQKRSGPWSFLTSSVHCFGTMYSHDSSRVGLSELLQLPQLTSKELGSENEPRDV